MSKIRLHGSSSGYTEIAPVAASGNNTLTLPNDGTIISKDSNGAVGVTSITVGTGVTIGDGRVTCTTLHGSAANCTQIPAANIVGVATAGASAGGFSDLVKIASATWTSAVSSVTIDNLDTTTYKYFILLWNNVPSDDGRRLSFRWRLSGSDTTASSYDWNFGETYGSSTSNLAENADKGEITGDMGNQAWEGCQLEFVIYPKSSAEAGYQGNSVFWQGVYHTNSTYIRGINGSLFYEGGASHYPDGFKFYMNVGNLATGDYALYGVKR